MKPVSQLYLRRMVIAAIIYSILIVATRYLMRDLTDSPLRYPVALLPVLPVLFGVFALISFVRGIDELQRQIQLEGIAFSLGVTGLITFSIGLLEGTGIPFVSMTWVLPMMIALWGIGTAIASRHYQ